MGVIKRLRGTSRQRVVVLGLDGVPLSLLTEHPDRFEHITDMIETGSVGSIESVVPPESSASWPSLTTGLNPGETGVYGLVDRELESYRTYVTGGNDVQAPHVWDHVTEAELGATVVNVPVTHPPQRNLQRMVAGFLAPDIERAVYPQHLAEILRSLDYRLDVDATLARDGDLRGFLEDAYETLDARFEVFAHFIDIDDWDLFVGVFMTPDRVNHFLFGDYLDDGPYREDFLSFYEQLDTYVGAIRNRLPDDVSLVLVSDHGFDRLDHEVQVNHWLADRGWLSYQDTDSADLVDVDRSTRAYSLAPGRFYLNLKGREPGGRIPEEEYEPVRNELRDELLEWTGPDGRHVIDRVVTRESVYRGPHLVLAPDLVAVPASGFDLKSAFAHGRSVFAATARTGMHRVEDAALVFDGLEADLDEATIYDVAPTVLRLLDLEVDRGSFDGVSLV